VKIDARSSEGNAFAIMGYVQQVFRDTDQMDKWPEAERRMKSGNYDNLCDVAEEVTDGSITIVNRHGEVREKMEGRE
jgi:hypothetical protein